MRAYHAAVIQYDIVNGNIQANVNQALDTLDELSEKGVSLAVLPEMFSCGFDNEHLEAHAESSGDVLDILCRKAQEKGIAISGSLPEAADGGIYNTAYFIDRDGRIKGSYRKLHLFRPTFEHRFYKAGRTLCVADTSLGKIGLATCYDLRFPELFRALMVKGAQLVLLGAQWPKPRIEHWRILVRARSVENQCYMVCTNRTGQDKSLIFTGNSMITDPDGKVLADPLEIPGAGIARIDLDALDTVRKNLPFLGDRRPDIYA